MWTTDIVRGSLHRLAEAHGIDHQQHISTFCDCRLRLQNYFRINRHQTKRAHTFEIPKGANIDQSKGNPFLLSIDGYHFKGSRGVLAREENVLGDQVGLGAREGLKHGVIRKPTPITVPEKLAISQWAFRVLNRRTLSLCIQASHRG